MPLGNSASEQDLIKHLAETLVEREVMEPMNKIGWSHASPPPPEHGTTPSPEGAPTADPSKQPQPTSGQPAPPAVPDAKPNSAGTGTPPTNASGFNIEDFKDPTTGLYFGKYKTPNEALNGLGHLADMAKTSFKQRDAALQEVARINAEMDKLRTQSVSSPGTVPNTVTVIPATRADADRARAALDKVLAELVEEGGVLDEDSAKRLAAAQSELSRCEAKVATEEALASREQAARVNEAKWAAVDQYMKNNYPDALNFTEEIGLFIQTNPLLQEAIAALTAQGKEIKASELAWTEYKKFSDTNSADVLRTAAVDKEQDLTAREQVRSELVDQARKDAGIVTGSSGGQGVHSTPAASGPSREEIEAAAAEMRRTGEAPGTPGAARFRDLIIGRFLDDSVFGPRG